MAESDQGAPSSMERSKATVQRKEQIQEHHGMWVIILFNILFKM